MPHAHGDRSPRVVFDAVGDRNPVPGRAGCPPPERRAPGRAECPRLQETRGRVVPARVWAVVIGGCAVPVGGRAAIAEGVLHRPEVMGRVVLVDGRRYRCEAGWCW